MSGDKTEPVIWHGSEAIVIGTSDDDGNVLTEFVIKQGEEIPPHVIDLMIEAGSAIGVPRLGPYSRAETAANLRAHFEKYH